MIPHPLLPKRPQPASPRARAVVEWAEVLYYVFRLVFSAVLLGLGLLQCGPELLRLVGG